jgi:hypothetical protein
MSVDLSTIISFATPSFCSQLQSFYTVRFSTLLKQEYVYSCKMHGACALIVQGNDLCRCPAMACLHEKSNKTHDPIFSPRAGLPNANR